MEHINWPSQRNLLLMTINLDLNKKQWQDSEAVTRTEFGHNFVQILLIQIYFVFSMFHKKKKLYGYYLYYSVLYYSISNPHIINRTSWSRPLRIIEWMNPYGAVFRDKPVLLYLRKLFVAKNISNPPLALYFVPQYILSVCRN